MMMMMMMMMMIIIDVQHGYHTVSYTIPLPIAEVAMDIIMRRSRFIPISCCIIMSDHDSGIDEASIGPLLYQMYQWCMLRLGLDDYQHYDGSP